MEAPVTYVETGAFEKPPTCTTGPNPFSARTQVKVKTVLAPERHFHQESILPGFVQPAQLACADIVLTSYSVVQRELDWAQVMVERRTGLADRPKLRLAQRYLCRPSPLTCVRWWRVRL